MSQPPTPPSAGASLEEVAAYYDQHDTVGPDGEFEGEPVEVEVARDLTSVYLVPLGEATRQKLHAVAKGSGQDDMTVLRRIVEEGVSPGPRPRKRWVLRTALAAVAAAAVRVVARRQQPRRAVRRVSTERSAGMHHSLRDLGLGVWLGVAFADALSLHPAGASPDPLVRVEEVTRRAPANVIAILAYGAGLLGVRRERERAGRPSTTSAELALTGVALAATVYRLRLTRQLVEEAAAEHQAGSMSPGGNTTASRAKVQHQLDFLDWVAPAVTSGFVAVRLREVAGGRLARAG